MTNKPGGLILAGAALLDKEPGRSISGGRRLHTRVCSEHTTIKCISGKPRRPASSIYSGQQPGRLGQVVRSLQWYSAEKFAQETLMMRYKRDSGTFAHQRTNYLRWGPNTVGWAMYLFRKRIERLRTEKRGSGKRSPPCLLNPVAGIDHDDYIFQVNFIIQKYPAVAAPHHPPAYVQVFKGVVFA